MEGGGGADNNPESFNNVNTEFGEGGYSVLGGVGVTKLKTTTEKLSSELGEWVKIFLQLIHLNRDTSDLGGGGM